MTMDIAVFVKDIDKFTQKEVVEKANKLKRKVALDLVAAFIDRSPVDTGRFRNNWQVDINDDPTGETGRDGDGEGQAAETLLAASTVIAAVDPGDDINIVNNVPYAARLEGGYSWRAPAGIVGPVIDSIGVKYRR